MQPTPTPTPRFAPTGEAGQTAAPTSANVSDMTTAKHAARTTADRTEDQTTERTTHRIGWPLVIALVLIAAVWFGGAVWSFAEQTAYATFKHFEVPELLPLVIDGFAVAMAAVAWAASLDGRAAVLARIGTTLAVLASATSNAAWAFERSSGDQGTIALAIAVPVIANVAFEVLLAEIRKQVQRRRGVLPPVQVPFPRLLRIVLAPWSTYFQWRRLVLAATDMRSEFEAAQAAVRSTTHPDRTAAVQDHSAQVDRSGKRTGGRSTPVQRPRTGRRSTKAAAKRTTPKAVPQTTVQTTPSPVEQSTPQTTTGPDRSPMALADRVDQLDRFYPDRIPGRNEAMRDLSWTSAGETSKALGALRERRGVQPAGEPTNGHRPDVDLAGVTS